MVSVGKLKEGWDVKDIGVIVALRALTSQTLTEQILGRGLRLPYGTRTGEPLIGQVDIVAHDSYRRLLAQKGTLIQRVITGRPRSAGSPAQFSLSDITDAEARAAGAGFAGEIGVPLVRVALSVRRTAKGGMSVSQQAQPSQQATQQWLSASHVQRDLQRRVLRLGLVPQTEPELNAVTRIVAAFLKAAGAEPDSEVDWSAERARQAEAGIEALVQQGLVAPGAKSMRGRPGKPASAARGVGVEHPAPGGGASRIAGLGGVPDDRHGPGGAPARQQPPVHLRQLLGLVHDDVAEGPEPAA